MKHCSTPMCLPRELHPNLQENGWNYMCCWIIQWKVMERRGWNTKADSWMNECNEKNTNSWIGQFGWGHPRSLYTDHFFNISHHQQMDLSSLWVNFYSHISIIKKSCGFTPQNEPYQSSLGTGPRPPPFQAFSIWLSSCLTDTNLNKLWQTKYEIVHTTLKLISQKMFILKNLRK